MDRSRDRMYDDERGSQENNYRPRESDGPPRGGYREYRSPPRRARTPPSYRDSRSRFDDRRRSRSPSYAGRGGGQKERPRSPPYGGYSPRRDARPRSPPRGPRRYSRSPIRARSPPPSRREPSPYGRRPRSPLPSKRPLSPRDRVSDRRTYSPARQPRSRFPNENNYRPGEITRSPPRREEQRSRIASPMSSRRSSPPIHPDRLAQASSRSPGYRGPPPPSGPRGSGFRERTPPLQRNYPPAEPRTYRQRSPQREDDRINVDAPPPRQETPYRNGDSRPAPRGPSSYDSYNRESPVRGPPSEPLSMSAHNRPASTNVLSAPTQPRGGRGGPTVARPESRDTPYGGALPTGPSRGGRVPPSAPFHGREPLPSRDARPSSSDYIPDGPRSSYGRGRPSYEAPAPYAPPFRPNNSSSSTYPRTQRFNTTNHLASLPAIVPGGKALPSMDPAADKKLAQLEDESRKLREAIEEKQKVKRAMLRDWESKERESRRDGLRSELAEAQLEGLSGEQIGGAAF